MVDEAVKVGVVGGDPLGDGRGTAPRGPEHDVVVLGDATQSRRHSKAVCENSTEYAPLSRLVDLAAAASQRTLIDFRHSGGVTEVGVGWLVRPFEGQLS
jgi:hypothetical protein